MNTEAIEVERTESELIKEECNRKNRKIGYLNRKNERVIMHSVYFNLPYKRIKETLEALQSYISDPGYMYNPLVCLFEAKIMNYQLLKGKIGIKK
jgi:hypothetical protein